MNSFHFFTMFLLIVFMDSSVKALTCLQGVRMHENGREIRNTLHYSNCSDSSAICHRYDITASLSEQTSK